MDPLNSASHYNLGLILKLKGDLPGAETAYRKALQIDPQCADSRINLGAILLKNKDFTGAEAEWRAAIGIDPNEH